MIGKLLKQAIGKNTVEKGTSTIEDSSGGRESYFKNAMTQVFVESKNFGQQADTAPTVVEKEVERIVHDTKIKEVERIVEKPII